MSLAGAGSTPRPGPAWGYGGSGSAQLALAILLAVTDPVRLTTLEADRWRLDLGDIRRWLDGALPTRSRPSRRVHDPALDADRGHGGAPDRRPRSTSTAAAAWSSLTIGSAADERTDRRRPVQKARETIAPSGQSTKFFSEIFSVF